MVFITVWRHDGYDVDTDIYACQTKNYESFPGNRKNHKRLLGGLYG